MKEKKKVTTEELSMFKDKHRLKMVSLLMEDMLDAVEKGKTKLSPRTKAKYKKTNAVIASSHNDRFR